LTSEEKEELMEKMDTQDHMGVDQEVMLAQLHKEKTEG
jgi:hypothetical protein